MFHYFFAHDYASLNRDHLKQKKRIVRHYIRCPRQSDYILSIIGFTLAARLVRGSGSRDRFDVETGRTLLVV